MPPRGARRQRQAKTWKRRRDYHSKEYRNPFRQKKQSMLAHLPFRLFIFMFLMYDLVLVGYFLLFSPFFQITTIEVHGVDIVLTQQIRQRMSEQIKSRRWFILPQRSQFIFNISQARDHIHDLLSYQNLSVVKDGKKLVIEIHQQEGAVQWGNAQGIFLVGTDGVVLRRYDDFHQVANETEEGNYSFRASVLLDDTQYPLVYDRSETPVEISKRLVPQDFLDKLVFLEREFMQHVGVDITSIEIPFLNAPFAKVYVSEGWQVLFPLEESDQTIKNLLRLKVVLVEKFKEDRRRLQYIDVRTGEKIFYR